jgi:iron complex outermembrane receptor protein
VQTNWQNRKRRKHMGRAAIQFVLLGLVIVAGQSFAQESKKNLAEMSLEDLMNVEVTSVAKHEQSLSETAAAVYVITQ